MAQGSPLEQQSAADASPGVVAPSSVGRHLWLIVLVAGAVLWIAGAVTTEVTEDTILVPNVIILGSFLVPVCTVLFVLGRPRRAYVAIETLLLGFLAGGTGALVLSAGIEVWLLPDDIGTNLGVGLIEEGIKALVVLVVAQFIAHRVPRDGMVLGLTIGAGFAAFESAGYAMRALIESADQASVISILETEMNRAVLAPFGHLTWTALIGGAIFASAWSTGRFRFDGRVAWTFAGVMALHGLWDVSDSVAIRLTQALSGDGWTLEWPNRAAWVGSPTGAELVRFNLIYGGLLVVLSIVGVLWAIRTWRAYELDRWTAEHPRATG